MKPRMKSDILIQFCSENKFGKEREHLKEIDRMFKEVFELAGVCKTHGFYRKGNAMFRVHGDGVLQIIKLDRDRLSRELTISLGLQSMYSELRPQWFTSYGCIPRYCILDVLCTESSNPFDYRHELLRYERELTALREKGFEWLDSIDTQAGLADAICQLDISATGRILWNDAMKIAPFLCSEQYELAGRVVSTIIDLHDNAIEANQKWMSEEKFEAYVKRYQGNYEKYVELFEMISNHDLAKIQGYLKNNYTLSFSYVKFCRT